MGIFSTIKDKIFGHSAAAPAAAAPAEGGTVAAAAPVAAAPAAPVDVEAVLNAKRAASGAELHWETSIVDLMKLLDLDSSLGHRKELAKELSYTGDTDDSATMNIWLHKKVMEQLAANGGKVPVSLSA
ncbi:MAG: hypothetical protein RLY97_1537 [Pseudomonadota bacterium]|jgi:hypothetical protein